MFDVWNGLLLNDLCGGREPAQTQDIYDSLFQHGYRHATACLVVAVLVNHVRRLLVPWLGGFFVVDTIATMKMARSSPHSLIQQSLEFSWPRFLVWLGISYVVQSATDPLTETAASRARGPIWRIMWSTLIIAGAEHAFAHACWTAAQLYAHGALILRGGAPDQAFLQSLLDKNPWKASVPLGLVVWGLHHYLVPMATKLPRGRWAAGAVYAFIAMGTARVVRYSNYYFIALEASDMLVTFGWLGLVMGVVGVEALRDRLRTGGREPVRRAVLAGRGQMASTQLKPVSLP